MPGSRWLRSEVDVGWAWVVAAASFALQFVLIGTGQSFGIIYGSLMEEFKAGEAATAWVGALGYGLVFLNSPVTTALCEHFGCRAVTCAGSILCMMGLLFSSYVTSISTMYLTFSLLWGFGASLVFFPSMLTLRFFFDRKMSQANSISMSGAGVGTLVLNIVLKDINDRHGWRGCMRVLCGLSAVLFICGCMFRPPPADFYGANQWSEWSKKVGLLTKLRRMFNSRPWKVKGFALWVLAHSAMLFAYFVPYVHLIQLAKTLGISTSDGAVLVGYMSIAAIIGKLLCGRVADFPNMKRLYLLAGSALALAASNMGVTAATNYDGLLTYALIFGFFDGCFVVVVPQITQDIVGMPLAATALGCQYGVSAVTMTLGPPVTGQIYKVSGSYKVAFFAGAVVILVGVFLLYFVQRLRPDLTASKPWPEPITGQQQSANLIPGHSIESLISGLDTLSGLCITNPSPAHLSPGQMELGDYRRFGHHETEAKTSRVHEIEVTDDVTSISLECASLELDTADRRSVSRDSTILLQTTDHYSYSDVSRDSVVSEILSVPSDLESFQSGSVLSYTGNISITSAPDFERRNVLYKPGNYDVRSDVSTDASIAEIAGEIESNSGDDLARNTSKEDDILVDVSSSETSLHAKTSAIAVDVQSLVSWESADHQVPQSGSEMEMIKLPPPPASTKKDLTPSLITLKTAVDDGADDVTVNLELQTSSTLSIVHDNKAQITEENEKNITVASDMPHIVNLNQEEVRPTEARSIYTEEPDHILEDVACRAILNMDDGGQLWDRIHLEPEADDSTKSKLESSRDEHLDSTFAERLPPQEQWLFGAEKQIIGVDAEACLPTGVVSISHPSSDTSIQLMDVTVVMSEDASTEQETVGPYDIQPKQSVEMTSGPLTQQSASESSLDGKDRPTAQEELIRLPPPPRVPRTGTLVVVQDGPPQNPFAVEDGIFEAEDLVKQVLEECVKNDPSGDFHQVTASSAKNPAGTTSTVPPDQVETHGQENDAFVTPQTPSTTFAASSNEDYVQLPPPLSMPRIGTLIPLEEHEHDDDNEQGNAMLTSNERESAFMHQEGSPKHSTAVSPDLLSIEEQDPISTRQLIGVFHRSEPRPHNSINEPSQLSLLSQRLEAVAARQFEEEQSEASISTNDSMVFMVSTNQSAISTPLFSASHSVPLTPMRVYSSYLATPAPTAAQTPFSVPFSPTDASIIQTPADSSILHSPDESRTVNCDIKIEFDFEPSRHNSFADASRRDASGSFDDLLNPPAPDLPVYGDILSSEHMGTAGTQMQSISGASQLDTACSGMTAGLEGQRSKSDLFSSQGRAQDPDAVVPVCTNPFVVQSPEDSSTSNDVLTAVTQPPAEQSLGIPPTADQQDEQPVYPRSQLDAASSEIARDLEGKRSKSDIFSPEEQAQASNVVVAPLCTNPFLLQSKEDRSSSNSTENGLVASRAPDWQSLNVPAVTDKCGDGQHDDAVCSKITRGLEGQKSKSDLIKSEEQTQDPDSAQAAAPVCTNPFLVQSVEDNSTEDGALKALPPTKQWSLDISAEEYDEQPLKPALLGEFGEGNTEKEQVLPQDLNSLFSSNPFQPPTLSKVTENPDAQHSGLSDPWCPHYEFAAMQLPVDSCIRLNPPPPTSRRKRTLAILDNQVQMETDERQDFFAHFPIIEGSKEQAELPNFEVHEDVVPTEGYGYQESLYEQQPNTLSPKHDRGPSILQSEQIPGMNHLLKADTDLNNIANSSREIMFVSDVPLTISDAARISDSDAQPTDNVSKQSYDETDKSNDVTAQTNDVVKTFSYILIRPDNDPDQSERRLDIESGDRARIEPDESIGHSRSSNDQSEVDSTNRDNDVTVPLDDVTSRRSGHEYDDDRAPLLLTKEAEFCFVTVEDGELERASSSSSVATDESSSTDTSLSENEMPYHKLQAEDGSCGRVKTQ